MAVRDVLLYPDARLKLCAQPIVDVHDAEVARIVADLTATLDAHVGVGIAAPQIGEAVRIVAIDASRARRPVPNHGRLVLINPEITMCDGEISFREGCMSVPDFVAHITRAANIQVCALTPSGERLCFEAEGFEAVILQHEIDHLDGRLFIDRVKSARDLKVRK